MKAISNEQFLNHVEQVGIRLDRRFPAPQSLGYENDFEILIDWPSESEKQARTLAKLFSLFPSGRTWIWRRGGKWMSREFTESDAGPNHRIAMDSLLKQCGIEDGEYTLSFEPSERNLAQAIAFVFTTIACCVGDDIFVVADGSDFLLWLDHDTGIIVECSTENVANRFITMSQSADQGAST